MPTEDGNPLLRRQELPPFSAIRPEHVVPAMEQILAEAGETVRRLLDAHTCYTWDNLIQPLEELRHRLDRTWSPVSHLHAVADSEPLREAYNACLPKLSTYHTEMGHNARLYAACRSIAEGPEYATLGTAQRKIIDEGLRDFHLSGVDLPQEQKARFKQVSEALSTLASRFQQNVLDATHGWRKHVADPALLEGLPDGALALARKAADDDGLEGWVFTLDLPSYMPVLTYACDRDLRREMYEAYVTRASDQGPNAGIWDNTPVMEEILRLRHELAALLGFPSYAQYSLARKMARSPDEVLGFLRDLARRSRPMALRELDEVRSFARERDGVEVVEAWDVAYYSERLREHRYEFSQESLRPYFPLPRVLQGLFEVAKRLYGLDIRALEGVETWHPDVVFHAIYDEQGRLRGQFYLDPYARPRKRGGAWMGECVGRARTGAGLEHPVAYLVCNFTPPVGGKPSLLTHNEVLTLFHEFGHGLHHLLTQVDYPSAAGINGVAWDAVELPSQIMENWCWERQALGLFARHYESGAPLPDALYQKMRSARNFQSGMQMVRQLEFALFDFRLHLEYDPLAGGRIQQLLEQVREEVAVIMPPACNRFAHGFSHIFAGGYAAGYYSYKWAEVLSADAFSRFEEQGIFDRGTGNAFMQSVLEQGGSREPMDLFVEFRGREPRIEALLRHSGIAA